MTADRTPPARPDASALTDERIEAAAREDAGGSDVDWSDEGNLFATAPQRAAFRRGAQFARSLLAAAGSTGQQPAGEPAKIEVLLPDGDSRTVEIFYIRRTPEKIQVCIEVSGATPTTQALPAAVPAGIPAGMKLAEWQPIATAPKDGSAIRLFCEGFIDADYNPGGSVEGQWCDGWVGAVWDGYRDCWDTRHDIVPTHWMPLPAAPGGELVSAHLAAAPTHYIRARESTR